jgi:hypothetical protein
MNSERLYGLCEEIIAIEKKFAIQSALQNLLDDMNNLAGNPNEPSFQTKYATRFQEFSAAWRSMLATLEPQRITAFEEIGAAPFFLEDAPGDIDRISRENPHSPAVTRDKIQSFLKERASYLSNIEQLRDRLKGIGVQPYKLEPDSAELGFLIPRDLFHNRLDDLVKELGTVNRIIRVFSEIATGSAESVEVRQISTTDPIFFLGVCIDTAAQIGHAITWAIATWASVEGIRKLRSEAQKNKNFQDDEIKAFFDSKVDKTIQNAIEEKVTATLGNPKSEAGRHQEQRTDLAWALESILTRVERGMTVDIRFLPPVSEKDAEGKSAPEPEPVTELREIVPQLKFPPADPAPIRDLPPPAPPSEAKGK